jgi:Glycosyl transferase family 2
MPHQKVIADMPQVSAEPLLSIVVPTKNRYATLNIIVDQFMSWDSPDFELIIEDNSDDVSEFAPVLARYGSDVRLRYRHTAAPLAATENCEAAVARAVGKVVTFIGDDDSVTRHCIEAAQWMLDHEVEAIVCPVAGYTWPDMEHAVAVNNAYNGKLAPITAKGGVRAINVAAELDQLSRCGAQLMGTIPRLYQAMVQRKALDRLKAGIGTYFPGPVPDMANAVSLSHYIAKCVYADVPLVVAGQSKSSMSGKNSVRKHQGELGLEKSLPADTAERWDARIPRYWSAPTIWSEAAIKAAEATQQHAFVKNFSFARVYANCFAFNDRAHYGRILAAMRSQGTLVFALMLPNVLWQFGMTTLKRALTLFKKLSFGIKGTGADNVAEATYLVEALIEREGLMKAFAPASSGAIAQGARS